jgi:cell division septal protein FtsQ
MVRRIYKKPHRARKHKPLIAKASFWRPVCIFGMACGGVWLICFSPALEVREISVAGAGDISGRNCTEFIEGEVTKKIAFFDSKSILLFNLEQTKKEMLARFPQIQDVKIERQFPSKIIASVEERRGVAMFAGAAGKKFLVDSAGIAFEETAGQDNLMEISGDKDQGVIKLGDPAIAKETLLGILRIKEEMLASSGITAVSASVDSPERVILQIREGWYVYFNPLKDIDSQSSKLTAVLNDEAFKSKISNLEYIDVRFTRVYLKEKSQ